MKIKIIFTGLLVLLFLGCAKDGTREIDGEFLYIADAAVIKGDGFIYGVEMDEKMMELANQVKKFKRDDFDMVPVKIVGILSEKSQESEGWDTIVKIQKIISVSPPTGAQNSSDME